MKQTLPFAMIPRAWATNPALSATDFRVAIALLSFGPPGECHPKIATIAEACGLSRNTVKRAIVRLRTAGVMSVAERPGYVSDYMATGFMTQPNILDAIKQYGPTPSPRVSTNVSRGSAHAHAQNRLVRETYINLIEPESKETDEGRRERERVMNDLAARLGAKRLA